MDQECGETVTVDQTIYICELLGDHDDHMVLTQDDFRYSVPVRISWPNKKRHLHAIPSHS